MDGSVTYGWQCSVLANVGLEADRLIGMDSLTDQLISCMDGTLDECMGGYNLMVHFSSTIVELRPRYWRLSFASW